jgi:hypothetical protein
MKRSNLTVRQQSQALKVEIVDGHALGVWVSGTNGPELMRASTTT